MNESQQPSDHSEKANGVSTPPDGHVAAGPEGHGTAGAPQDNEFATAQQEVLVAIGHALIEQATSGVVALDLRVTQTVRGGDVDLDFDLSVARQSGLTLPAEASDALVEAVQQLVLLWRAHGRDPWRTFSYQLTRGESGPRFTTEFSF